MKIITEENEEFKASHPNLVSVTQIKDKQTSNNNDMIKEVAFIPDSKAYGPKIRGISPKYYHELTTKKIDDTKRTGI